jgi:hypothetical protein
MRPWLWEFMAWTSREWNMVQDAWWWNISALPVGGCNTGDLLRPSLRACVWLGPSNSWRNQSRVLESESSANRRDRLKGGKNHERDACPSRVRSETEGPRDDLKRLREACVSRGGVTPFNVIAMGSDGRWSGGTHGHGASTPRRLCDWWTRYICPPGGTICDPFMGSGTTGLSALKYGCDYIGIENMDKYHVVAERRICSAMLPLFQAK